LKASSFLAYKYLFSKTKFNIVSIISTFSVLVLTIAYFAFFTILSVFSGLENYSLDFSKSFDPDIKIFSEKNDYFKLDSTDIAFLSENIGNKFFSKIISGNVLVEYNGAEAYCKIIGVDKSFNNVIDFSGIISVGEYTFLENNSAYTSYSLAEKLDLTLFNSAGFFEVYSINNSYPDVLLSPFKNSKILFSKGVFTTRNNDNENIIICSLETAQSLFGLEKNTYSEIYLKNSNRPLNLKKDLKSKFKSLSVKSHKELNESLYKMMKSEKLIVAIIMIMIVLISVFNVIGSVIMLIVEKESDLRTLKVLGMNNSNIEKVFFKNGLMINFFGLIIGLFFGLIVVVSQKQFSLVKVGSIGLAYPVELTFFNVTIIVGTAILVGLASSYVSAKAVKKLI
jgi:lipoprotein-releasing system permease protein